MNAPMAPSEAALDLAQLGLRLQQGRMAAGWSLDDVAMTLHLPLATVTDLEAGRSERIGTPVYLKGFLRSYLKLLALPEDWNWVLWSVGGAVLLLALYALFRSKR